MRNKLINTLKKTKRFILNIKNPATYAEKGNELIKNGDIEKANIILEKGLTHYPNSILINRQYAILLMENKPNVNAAKYWNKVFKSKNKHLLIKEDFIYASQAYESKKDKEQFIKILNQSERKFKEDKDIRKVKLFYLFELARWEELIKNIENSYSNLEIIPLNIIAKLSIAYRELIKFEKADYILRETLKRDPKNNVVALQYAEVAVEQKKWKEAIKRYEYVIKLMNEEAKWEYFIRLVMLYKLIGRHDKAEVLLKDAPRSDGDDLENYEVITLFDNGESRIEYYKQKQKTKKVVIVFDSLHMGWNEDPFGFKLLSRQDLDIIAVRKRRKGTYQQDLSQEQFNDTLKNLVAGYEDKIAYGHSLGGYLSLYYASNLNCRILSLAPRLSIHPKFGRENYIGEFTFHHKETNNYNEDIQPIIVYDPKSRVDNRYVNEELLIKFPNAKLIKMPYGGHGIARHLLRMGLLKEFILKVIDGEYPVYDRSLKYKSANYCRLLGRECLKRNKVNWASKLAERAVELLPNERYVIKFQIDVFREKQQYIQAIDFAKESISLVPKSLQVRLYLIDLYIELKNIYEAEYELKKAEKLFGVKKDLTLRFEEIQELRVYEINQPLEFIK